MSASVAFNREVRRKIPSGTETIIAADKAHVYLRKENGKLRCEPIGLLSPSQLSWLSEYRKSRAEAMKYGTISELKTDLLRAACDI
ncbi:hypothetical protein ACFL2H_11080 [Planctomycetota bacterium]